MQLAMIGLGKMGGNMVERLMKHGHSLVAFDRDAATVAK
jgi:6-phosphogluconate dehydrogenase